MRASLRMNTDGSHHNCAQHRKVLMGETPTCRIVRYGNRAGVPQDRTAQHPCPLPSLPIQALVRSRKRRLRTECGSFNVSSDGYCTIMVFMKFWAFTSPLSRLAGFDSHFLCPTMSTINRTSGSESQVQTFLESSQWEGIKYTKKITRQRRSSSK